jgi:hypothetical protein
MRGSIVSTQAKQCHCGKPLHYTNKALEAQLIQLSADLGEYMNLTIIGGKTYRVQRHYVALHGIKGKDISTLGFEEVKQDASNNARRGKR